MHIFLHLFSHLTSICRFLHLQDKDLGARDLEE